MRLVIVESPAKCAKIQSFLGDGYRVIATMGHIRALQEKLDAVGIDTNWTPIYEELSTKKDAISKLRKAAKEADEVYLAADPDREGEGIAWHVCHILKLNPATTPRITFQEITKTAIQNAVANPRRLDMNLVNAQQARAMLDLLVGFTISRVLWKKVAPKLSAGRCQSPALRLVADRDTEIQSHTARNYWTLRNHVYISSDGSDHWLEGKVDKEFQETEVREILNRVGQTKKSIQSHAIVQQVKERVSTSNAPAPLITSTLQQEASALHGLGPKQTMQAAQKLYEAGHITYMRTDNPNLSREAALQLRQQISDTWGPDFVGTEGQHQIPDSSTATTEPEKPKKKASKPANTAKDKEAPAVEAQAAHEAIRPTHPERSSIPDVEPAQQTVYKLIWRRAVQSQMSANKTQVRTIQLQMSAIPELTWTAEQTRPDFDGWRIVEKTEKAKELQATETIAWNMWTPHLKVGSDLHCRTVHADETFTKPPGRFTEATLIRELEKRGIGRPSTFASLVSTLFDREYVEKTNKEGLTYETRHLQLSVGSTTVKETKETHKSGAEKNKICATPLGISVSQYLQTDFQDLFAYDFTAHMESSLDEISKGNKPWKDILEETWATYKDRYSAILKEKDSRSFTVGVGNAENAENAENARTAKVVQTRKGPFLVRAKADGSGDEFAALPTGVTVANAETKLTPESIEAAFAAASVAKEGEEVGTWDSHVMRKKKGPYGFYVEANGIKVPWKPEDTEDTLCGKFEAKKGAYERKVGDFTIKKGPYGLYFYKHTLKTMKFHKFPATSDPDKITAEELIAAIASTSVKSDKKYVGKAKEKTKEKKGD
jgi:DNA topoisomerase-1